MSELAEQTKRLSPAKRALLDKLLKAPAGGGASRTTIPRRGAGDSAPLSFAQQRLWFFDRLEPQNPFYNISAEVPIDGPLDVSRLEQCLLAVIDRHEALRTVFRSEGGEARQVVLPKIAWRLARIDLAGLPDKNRRVECERLAVLEAERPFDLTAGPLFRATLIDLGENQRRLILVVHHIVCDGWSMNVMRQELAALYAASDFPPRDGGRLPLPALGIQFADYAAWQRERLTGELLEKQLAFWRTRLGEGSPFLELPADRPRPLVQTFRGDSTKAHAPRPVIESLKSICREEQATLFMGLLAAFQTLLSRYSGQTDISVGSPIANRQYPEVEPLVGFFANTLVHRADLSGEPTFRELLKQTRENALGAFAHQETPFERIVETIAPERDLGRTPLFQAMLVLQNTAAPELVRASSRSSRELSVGQPRIGLARTANFELTLNVEETPTGADLLLVFNADLFDRSSAERMLSAFQSLLKGIAAGGADQKIARLPMLTPAEQRRLLVELNDTDREHPSHLCLHELFSEQAAQTPDAAAVIDETGSLTYSELDRRSNQLARRLRILGVKAETPVGICLDRSSAMIVGLLGILKAGGAYVPLDPRYPAERLAFMLGDSRPKLVLSRASIAQSLLAGAAESHTALFDIDQEAATIDAESADRLPPMVTPDNLAYIIYTSGSTGNPKGVLMHHRGVVNFVGEYVRRVGMGEGDRMLQVVSLSFDASIEEIFTTLSSGAALVMHGAPAELAPCDLLAYMKRKEVNLLHFPPSLWQGLVDELASHFARTGEDATGYNFKAFLTGGEPVAAESLRLWDELTGRRVRFVAAYGVTEAAVTTTIYDSHAAGQSIDSDWRPSIASPCIGRPIGNTRIYVLDSHLQPVPAGAPGELCIGGLGVARGYWNLPGLTAEKFLPDPYSPHPGSRLYRTGDLGRLRPDGSLEFLGRIDSQVKIRGFRIEVGEIEAALLKRPEVREAVVIAREDKPGVKRLAAYLTTTPGEGETPAAELRAHLKALLPEHMIPASFTWLESLPLTASQKVDRRRLPAPDLSRREGDGGYAPAQSTVEKQLAEIWSGVLGVPQVGRHDNFFELGGDSILTIQVISRAAEAGLHFTPKQLFLHQTIAELAPQAAESPAIVAEQGPIVGEIVATPIQREFFALKLADEHHFNQAVLLSVRDRLSAEIVEKALAALVEHHDALRLFVAGDEQLAIAPAGEFTMRRHAVASSPEIAAIAATSQASFDLSQSPLLRADWFELPAGETPRLLLSIHHLAVDGVSWRILLEDLGLFCRQLSSGQSPAPFRKTTSIRQWSERLRGHAESGGFESELDYWLTAPPSTLLPRDSDNSFNSEPTASESPSAANLERDARSVSLALSHEETQSLLSEAQAAYRTQIGDLLLTAVSQTLGRWFDDAQEVFPADRRLAIDLEGHGREPLFDNIDLSRTVGWFTSLYPIALPLAAVESGRLADDIKAVKETLRAAPAGGVGYGALKWLTSDVRAAALRLRPRAEISFNYLGQFDQVLGAASPFGLAAESAGPLHSPRQERTHLLEILAHVESGQLHFRWIYNERFHSAKTIAWLAETCMESLRRLIEHCLSPDAGGFIPADFPLANIDASDLDALSHLLQD